MKHKTTLFGIFSLTLFSLGVWIVIFFNINPTKADKIIYIAFLASLFLWVSGIITFIEYLTRIKIAKTELTHLSLNTATRHAVMIAFTLTLLLGLQFLHILNIIDAIIIIVIISTTELYFKGRIHAKPINSQK